MTESKIERTGWLTWGSGKAFAIWLTRLVWAIITWPFRFTIATYRWLRSLWRRQ